ncbi:MAG: ECF transporter S component [Acutalibacteraceae bacterium]
MSKKYRRLILLSLLLLVVVAPISLILSVKLFQSNNYYASALLIVILSILPFFVFFENRKIKTGEIVILSVMIALCVASRAVMAFIPQVKPTCAFVIVSAIAFGPNVGFVIGSLSMFVSNFIFGQGLYTPFQMLGMGLVGFFCGLLFCGSRRKNSRLAVSIIGGLMCFVVYGLAVDSCSVLTMVTEYTPKAVLSIYASGLLFNLIHGLTTALLLFFICKPMADKFQRLRVKYGIFDPE